MGNKCLQLFAFWSLFVPPLFGQRQNVSFERISLEHGLSQSSVFSIVQDRQGFMWFATQDGLNRFDGYSFTVFRQNFDDSTSLSSNFCKTVFADRRGNVWIGTEAAGVDRYDAQTNTFRNFRHNPDDSPSLTSNAVGPLAEDSSGRIWVGTDKGLNLFNPENGTIQHFIHSPRDVSTLSGNAVSVIFRDRVNRMWVGTGAGPCLFDDQGQEFIRYPVDSMASHVVQGFGEDEKGDLWMTTARGLYVLDRVARMFRISHRFFHGKALTFVIPDGKGALWIGSHIGLIEFHPLSRMIRVHTKRALDAFSPSSNTFLSAYRDRSGVLWFGTFSGINRYAPARTKFKTYRHSKSDPGSISESNVRSFCEDHTGALWIATMNGLNRFRESTGSFSRYHATPAGLSSNLIWEVREERRGNISAVWAGTNAHGVNEITFSGEGRPGFRHYLAGRSIASLTVEPNGVVWAGDLNGELYRYHPSAKEFKVFDAANDKRVVALYQLRNGDIWTGSLGNGANRIRSSTGESSRFRHDPSRSSSLSDNHVISFYEDGNGALWIGTYGGLNKYNAADESFTRYTTKDGLPNDVIYGILGDDRGRLWLSTNMGISRFDTASGICRNFDVTDGLQGNEFNQGAAYRAQNGMMYFGGIHGFNVFHPDSIQDNPHAPSVVITDFRIFNRSFRGDEARKRNITGSIGHVEELMLSYSDNVFSFEYAALEYTNPGKNRYAYMMDGFDKGWRDVGGKREATYTNLDPGTYYFRVKASNSDGVWNEEGVSVAVVITPPFWMTWWFRGIFIAGFLSVGPVIYFRRVGVLRRENELQKELSRKLIDSQESERKRIAAELHDSVGQDLLIIKNKLLLGLDEENGGRDQRKEFQDAVDHVSNSLKHVREISRNLRPVQLDQLGLTAAIESVIETVTGAAHLEHSLHLENIDGILSKDSEIHLFRIVQETLNNIVKHAGKCSVSVELRFLQDTLSVRIADTGVGFDASRKWPDGGLGLSGIAERAKILGGQFAMESNPGKGTTVTVTIPSAQNA